MADILIRGMDMPDGCHHCRFSYLDKGETNDGEPCSVIMCSAMEQGTNGAEYDGNRPFWCPLAPLPEGHGDLIDKQAFIADIAGFIECMTNVGVMADGEMLWGKLLDALANAKTIVPEEGGTDNGN